MSVVNREASIDWTIDAEGGAKYTNRPHDRGGPTKFGITLATLSAWRHAPMSPNDVQYLLEDEARAIYHGMYLDAVGFDGLDSGVDHMVSDFGVTSGPSRAVRFLQHAALVPIEDVDGRMGPRTIAAARLMEPSTLIRKLFSSQVTFYTSIGGPEGIAANPGWQPRAIGRRDKALQLAGVTCASS